LWFEKRFKKSCLLDFTEGTHPILMSDRGVRYACREYVALLQAANMKISMSRTGNPYDNAHMESFFKTLKYEEVHLSNYETFDDVTQRLPLFSSSRKGIDNSQARRYCWGQKKRWFKFPMHRVSTNGTNRNRNSLFPVLAAITTMRGLTIILWIV